MERGTWSETNKPSLPGFYNRFKTVAQNTIAVGAYGTLAITVKANWGPAKEVTKITSEPLLASTFGNDTNYTAYKLGLLALLGSPKELLVYRVTDGSETIASITLKNADTSPADLLILETKYPTKRDFNVTTKTNLTDSTQKDIVLYEGTTQIIEFKGLPGDIDAMVSAINSNLNNDYLVAKKVANATGTLASVANVKFTGGNDGCTAITNENYLDAMSAFEKYKIDGFVFDGITDESLQNSAITWGETLNENGADVFIFLGGDGAGDNDIETANERSKSFDNEYVINVGSDGIYNGVTYTPAEAAVYVAGLAMGLGIQESLCNRVTIFENTNTKLSRDDKKTCLAAGTLIFSVDDDKVVIVDDKNTFTSYTDEKNETLGYFRAVRFISIVNQDTALEGDPYVGKIINDDTGKVAIISALKQYFEELNNERIIDKGFIVEIDSDLQAKAKNDEVFWKWSATYLNVMKKIYGTGYVS